MTAMTKPIEIEGIRQTGELSFREFVERHKQSVYYLSLDLTGNHHDAEDLSQEVFIRAHKGLSDFRGDSSALTWLRRIALNLYLNRKRKKSWAMLRFFSDSSEEDTGTSSGYDGVASESESADAGVAERIMNEHIHAAMDRLSPRERSAFVLRFLQDLSVREIADEMEVAEGTIKSLLYRAGEKMKNELNPLRVEVTP